MKARDDQKPLVSNSNISPWVTLKGARLETQPWDGQEEGDGLLGVHEWAGQDCGS